ncbi:MAG: 4Fe-4S dicluster domain-containing protein [Clostridia bacterium]|nr:4Fe-4S dicluster domain-containing protein [Clostridia bacterium]
MRKFDTKVQHLKYKVLREVAKCVWAGTLLENIMEIPKVIVPGKEATMRCCVYKERAIVGERIKLAMGGDKDNPNVIEVIDIACDECPVSGYEVTSACRGCLQRRCEDVCKFGAITFDNYYMAHIDRTKCKECGACAKACPFLSIVKRKRPCESACRAGAITMSDEKAAQIDNSKCTRCGACSYHCPFGAMTEKSYIVDVIEMLKNSRTYTADSNYDVYAIIAPSVSSQFSYAKLGQVVSGLKKLGFYEVVETALGADMVAIEESRELAERGLLTSSCCPAFVEYIKSAFPSLEKYISKNPSPMAMLAKYIKEHKPNAKVVFVGPCTAKKAEAQLDEVKPYVDSVLTFEELQALFDSRNIEITTLEETNLDNASYFGRMFAKSGGLTDAVKQAMKEEGIEFDLKPVLCDGLDECRTALLKLSQNKLDGNFIEGMACLGGCINGAGILTHSEKNKLHVEKHGQEAIEKSITDALKNMK